MIDASLSHLLFTMILRILFPFYNKKLKKGHFEKSAK
jgi:hypothetical protein